MPVLYFVRQPWAEQARRYIIIFQNKKDCSLKKCDDHCLAEWIGKITAGLGTVKATFSFGVALRKNYKTKKDILAWPSQSQANPDPKPWITEKFWFKFVKLEWRVGNVRPSWYTVLAKIVIKRRIGIDMWERKTYLQSLRVFVQSLIIVESLLLWWGSGLTRLLSRCWRLDVATVNSRGRDGIGRFHPVGRA